MSIESKLESLKDTLGSEIVLEVRKVVQSMEREVKQFAAKWKLDISNESDYIDGIYGQFQEEIKRTCAITGIDGRLRSVWGKSNRRQVKTTISECQ